MLPWEHVAGAYVAYSLFSRLAYGRPPRDDAVLVVVVAALLPDLIDKPLAWGLHVLPSGKSLAHSLLFAGSAIALSVLVTGRRLGVAFALTYLGHLGGDVVFPMVYGHSPHYRFLLYPLVDLPVTDAPGLLFHTRHVLYVFFEFLQTTRGRAYVVFEGLLLGTAVVLWLIDRRPGPAAIRTWFVSAGEERSGS